MCDWARDIGHCAQDGTGLILASGIAQNHQFYDINPNTAVGVSTTYAVPYEPVYNAAQQTALNAVGDVTGVAFSGGKVYSAYGGPTYGTVASYYNSATYAEGDTFDQCGGHSSSTSQASYHYHIPPSCLLKQLGQTEGQHSPQVGWMADVSQPQSRSPHPHGNFTAVDPTSRGAQGFPLYGPLGPGGVAMKTCTETGNVQPCTDDCAGYYADTGDGYAYRYYMLGTFNDGSCCTAPPGTSEPGPEFFPFTPLVRQRPAPSVRGGWAVAPPDPQHAPHSPCLPVARSASTAAAPRASPARWARSTCRRARAARAAPPPPSPRSPPCPPTLTAALAIPSAATRASPPASAAAAPPAPRAPTP